MKVDEIFFAFMSLFSVLILIGVHVHIKNKLGARHDNGLLFAAGAMSAWLLMAIWEWYGKIHFPAYNLEVRKFISIINTGLFLSSLIYFKDSWYKVNKYLENIKYHIIAIISTVLLLIAYVIIPQTDDWSYFEGWISIVVAVLLSSSMSVTLYFREDESQDKKMSLLFFIPIISGILLISAQIFDDGFIKYSNFDPIDNKNYYLAFRMLSRPMLVISYLLVAMTWLQKKQDELNFFKSIQNEYNKSNETTNPNEPSNSNESPVEEEEETQSDNLDKEDFQKEGFEQGASIEPNGKNQHLVNRIAFSDTEMKIGITLQTDTNVNFNEAELFFGRSRESYKLLKRCASKMKEKGYFNIQESGQDYKDLGGSSNFSKVFNDIIKLLNEGKLVKGHGRNPLPDTPIVYQRFFVTGENTGDYKLPFLCENIIFLTHKE